MHLHGAVNQADARWRAYECRAGDRDRRTGKTGGERALIERLEPTLKGLAVEGGYVHAGSAASGHFVELVHNGIEFGLLQTIGEGTDLVEQVYRQKGGFQDVAAFI